MPGVMLTVTAHAPFNRTCANVGTVQKLLAWPLRRSMKHSIFLWIVMEIESIRTFKWLSLEEETDRCGS